MKKNSKTLLTIMLTVALIFTFMPITTYAAAPNNPSATTTWDFTGVDKDGSGSYGGGTWMWLQSTNTLILTNLSFSTSAEGALIVPDNTTIILIGVNTITSTYNGAANQSYGIRGVGNLTINGSGTLTTKAGNAEWSFGIYAYNNLTICDNITINSTSGTATSSDSDGVFCFNGDITVGGDAILNATAGDAARYSAGICLNKTTGNLIINNNAKVNSTASASLGNDSCGCVIKNAGYIKLNSGMLTAIGNNRAFTINYTVPAGYKYWSNTTTSPSTTELTGNGLTTVIDNSSKYAKVQYTAPVTGQSGTIKTDSMTVLKKPASLKLTKKKVTWKNVKGNNGYTLKVMKGKKVILKKSIKKNANNYQFTKADKKKFNKGNKYYVTLVAKGKANVSKNSPAVKSKAVKLK